MSRMTNNSKDSWKKVISLKNNLSTHLESNVQTKFSVVLKNMERLKQDWIP